MTSSDSAEPAPVTEPQQPQPIAAPASSADDYPMVPMVADGWLTDHVEASKPPPAHKAVYPEREHRGDTTERR